MTTWSVNDEAKTAVEQQLDLKAQIDEHEVHFLDELISSHEYAKKQAESDPSQGDFVFFKKIIPIVSSFMQVCVDPKRFREAADWARRRFDSDKPISILTALTTAYLVERGCDNSVVGSQRAAVWSEINERLQTLLARIPPRPLAA